MEDVGNWLLYAAMIVIAFISWVFSRIQEATAARQRQKEIEEALLTNRVDVAVHSLKDLPTQIAKGLTLAAVLATTSGDTVSPRARKSTQCSKGAGESLSSSIVRWRRKG